MQRKTPNFLEHKNIDSKAVDLASKRLKVSQHSAGFTLFTETSFEDPIGRDITGKTFPYIKRRLFINIPDAKNPVHYDATKLRRSKKKTLTVLNQLFPQKTQTDFCAESKSFALKINKLDTRPVVLAEHFSEELYWPIAFEKGGKTKGGIYVYPWLCGTEKQTTSVKTPIDLPHNPIKKVMSASCIFGNTLTALDQEGDTYNLCDPNLHIPDGRMIVDIFSQKQWHPSEVSMSQTFANLFPFAKVLTQDSSDANFAIHIAREEYLLTSVDLFLRRKLSHEMFNYHRKLICERNEEHRVYWQQLAENHDMKVEFSSPLAGLKIIEENFIENILKKYDLLDEWKDCPKDKMDDFIKKLMPYLVKELAQNASDQQRKVWNFVIANKTIPLDNLSQLAKLSWVIIYALEMTNYKSYEVCMLQPAQEKPMGCDYRKTFADKFGPIVCFNWIPPVHVCVERCGNFLFYLNRYFDQINFMLEKSIINTCFMQTAFVALDQADNLLAETESAFQLIDTFETQQSALDILRNLSRTNTTRTLVSQTLFATEQRTNSLAQRLEEEMELLIEFLMAKTIPLQLRDSTLLLR